MTVDGDRVVRVRGDADHPVSRGYTCSKGRGLPQWHHSPRTARPPARARPGRELAGSCSPISGPRSQRIIDAHGRRRGRALPRYRARVRRGRSGRRRPVARRRSAAGPSTPRRRSTTRRCSSRRELVDWQPDAEPGVGPDRARPARLRRHQPGGLARLRHRAPGPGPLPARVPRRGGRVWVLDPRRTETAAHGRRAPAGAARRRRDGARGSRQRAAGTTAPTTRAARALRRPRTSPRCATRWRRFTIERAAAAADVDARAARTARRRGPRATRDGSRCIAAPA